MSDSIYDWHRFKRFLIFSGVCFLAFGVVALLYQSLLIAMIVSLILTYVLNPLVKSLEDRSNLGRRIIVFAVSFTFFGVIFVIGASIVPSIYSEIIDIAKQIPKSVVYLNQHIVPVREWLVEVGIFSYASFDKMVLNLDIMQKVTNTTTNALQQLWSSTPKVLGGALNTFIVPVLTWFSLSYIEETKRFVKTVLPRDIMEMSLHNIRNMDQILRAVVKGQLLIAFILSCLYMLGFSLIGLQSGVAIGAVAGLCRVVPYLDILVGSVLSLVVIISSGGSLAMVLAVIIVIAIVQGLDGAFITPRVIGERAGIHPVMVISSVIAFGDWFGLMGIVVAGPVVAILAHMIQMAIPYYQASPFYKANS